MTKRREFISGGRVFRERKCLSGFRYAKMEFKTDLVGTVEEFDAAYITVAFSDGSRGVFFIAANPVLVRRLLCVVTAPPFQKYLRNNHNNHNAGLRATALLY